MDRILLGMLSVLEVILLFVLEVKLLIKSVSNQTRE
jgi:hypothetical protein